ncbi:hypothetical protein ASPZODRAFT_130573 [Penicilliopsis zonata CBS 506.65]|uniref:DHHA2 domain-containing protein n=1 Tax=Penicilliopsis zonata CBS 506.65 TaxID=1073090 RepID=A0A1L9SN86_9EURO|nr:hypothetical protein ASPZODRAFT_130573 [Penicilliopsis zonata CBS 506.65]OJJ48514.1 hypothetical protein ASPZODRAFT_130573 [Penicilliopsis zonata CBS 506.65]
MAEHLSGRISLLQFLRQSVRLHVQHLTGSLAASAASPVYVVGNPSADLDSIVSAIVYAYFASGSNSTNGDESHESIRRPHIPLINLPDVRGGAELRRLRPEFVTALSLATESRKETASLVDSTLSEHLITVADFAAQIQDLKKKKRKQDIPTTFDATLVDWNALPLRSSTAGEGALTGLERVTFRIQGCIDHHVDEGFLPPQVLGRVEVGPGSCASLVVDELRKRGMWGGNPKVSDDDDGGSEELCGPAKLALSAILIDTNNLTAEGRVMQVDRASVSFLQDQIQSRSREDAAWDSKPLFQAVREAKASSLDLLTVEEILDRDYKEWSAAGEEKEEVKIGFCAVVRPLHWVVGRAGTPASLVEEMYSFARQRGLDVLVLMTAFNTDEKNGGGEFRRELFLWAVTEHAVAKCESFANRAEHDLGLRQWDGEAGIRSTLNAEGQGQLGWRRVWMQTDVTKSRKQVAPLVRSVWHVAT